MAAPEMEFTIAGGDHYPGSFHNDYLCCQQDVFTFLPARKPESLNKDLQAHLPIYTHHWMKISQGNPNHRDFVHGGLHISAHYL